MRASHDERRMARRVPCARGTRVVMLGQRNGCASIGILPPAAAPWIRYEAGRFEPPDVPLSGILRAPIRAREKHVTSHPPEPSSIPGHLFARRRRHAPRRARVAAILSPSMSVDRDLDAVTGDGKSITLKRAEVQELGESLRGNLLLAGPSRLRSGAPRVERADGQASRVHRAAARSGRRQQRRSVRARLESARRREVRRPQPVRQIDLRTRHADRPVAPARRASRCQCAHRARGRRQPAGRPGP